MRDTCFVRCDEAQSFWILDLVSGASLFYTELLARLCSLATPFPSVIGRLCSQCEECLLASPEPVLIPKCSFLQQPGGALQHTLTGLGGGKGKDRRPLCPLSPVLLTCDLLFPGVVCLEVSVAAGLLVAGSDDGRMAVWNLADRQLVHSLFGHTGVCLRRAVSVLWSSVMSYPVSSVKVLFSPSK